ncbi:MAG: hypothetical protein OSJ64_01775 [Firmicutes bacterium]|nr:hypothetical protein [Bacillota bacterium]
MSSVIINDINCEGVQRAELLLGDIPGESSKAIRKAAEAAAKYMRTASRRIVRQHYAISAEALRDKDICKVSYSIWDGLSVNVKFAGHKIPLYRFNDTSPKRPTMQNWWAKVEFGESKKYYRPSVPVYAHQLKSSRPKFLGSDAFVAEMKNANGHNHTGIFRRTGNASVHSADHESIAEVMGPSIKDMLDRAEVREELSRQTADKFDEAIEQTITDILMGRR